MKCNNVTTCSGNLDCVQFGPGFGLLQHVSIIGTDVQIQKKRSKKFLNMHGL